MFLSAKINECISFIFGYFFFDHNFLAATSCCTCTTQQRFKRRFQTKKKLSDQICREDINSRYIHVADWFLFSSQMSLENTRVWSMPVLSIY